MTNRKKTAGQKYAAHTNDKYQKKTPAHKKVGKSGGLWWKICIFDA